MKQVVTAAVVFVVAGCTTANMGGYRSPEHRLASGSKIELTQTLKLPYRQARTYIQGGEAMSGRDVNRYEPFCSFGLNVKRDGKPLAEMILPASFEVGETRIGATASAEPGAPSGMLAYGGVGVELIASQNVAHRSGGTPWPYYYYTVIELYSEQQPQVDDLTCAYNGNVWDRNLTLAEIRDTLGDVVLLNP